MTVQVIESVRDSMAQAILDAVNAGAGAGIIAVYSGTKPATPATALSGNTLLAKLTLADPAGTVASGALTWDFDPDISDAAADATDTATWFRVYSSADGTTINEANSKAQGTVTATGGGGDMTFTGTGFVTGEPITLTSGTWTMPGA